MTKLFLTVVLVSSSFSGSLWAVENAVIVQDGTAASFVLNDSHVGFDGRGKTLFVEGPLFGRRTRHLRPAKEFLAPGSAFTFEAIRQKGTTRFLIDKREIHRTEN